MSLNFSDSFIMMGILYGDTQKASTRFTSPSVRGKTSKLIYLKYQTLQCSSSYRATVKEIRTCKYHEIQVVVMTRVTDWAICFTFFAETLVRVRLIGYFTHLEHIHVAEAHYIFDTYSVASYEKDCPTFS